MRYSITELNRRIRDNPQELVKQCEADYQIQIEKAAAQIAANVENSHIALLSGPSGSGKTTTAMKLERELEKNGIVSHTISIDNYFHDVDMRCAPRTPDGNPDFEHPDCVDMELLNEHFLALNKGEEISIPKFMFSRQKRSASVFQRLKLKKNEIAIFEGIHALNDTVTIPNPDAAKIYISALIDYEDDDSVSHFTGTWLRLMRRVVRDNNFRGASAAYTIALWGNVLRGERLYIEPYMNRANITINSALPYEVAVTKQFARPLFADLPDDNPQKDELSKILPALERFDDLTADYVPPESLLREFIGDSVYYN